MMKDINISIVLYVFCLLLLTQCGVITTVPPVKDTPTDTANEPTSDTPVDDSEVPPPPPPVNNPLVTKIGDDPLKNGHPNLEADVSVQSKSNFKGSRGAEAFIGQMKIFAGNFAPRGWALCNGQILSIRENQALFSLLGTTYGGDGRTTFALPDLRGRAPVHAGKTEGGVPAEYKLGKRYGTAKANLYNEEYQKVQELRQIIEVSDGVTIPTQGIKTQPTFGINYIIALDGVFPSRS